MDQYQDVNGIREKVEKYSGMSKEELQQPNINSDVRNVASGLVGLLEKGEVRAAEKGNDGLWHANQWVKEGILLAMKSSGLEEMNYGVTFKDKELVPPQDPSSIEGARVVPGGTSVRGGSYLEGDNVVMPPTYMNVGSYVGRGTMLDSHSLVGSCAQVGRDSHVSAGAQIGGVLEPIQASPCVVEDGAFMGMNTSIAEGTVLRGGSVISPGVNLTSGTPIYDRTRGEYIDKVDGNTYVPENAIVVPGMRTVDSEKGISMQIGVIPKYKDETASVATALNEDLR